jgi:hypothetical protein
VRRPAAHSKQDVQRLNPLVRHRRRPAAALLFVLSLVDRALGRRHRRDRLIPAKTEIRNREESSMASTTPAGATPYYFIPAPSRTRRCSRWACCWRSSARSQWINHAGWAHGCCCDGAGRLAALVLFQWFRQAIGESEGGLYSDRVDVSFRWSMSWFIFSEVMFFAAFFGALYWARVFAPPCRCSAT